jgi:hypothetical protein
MSDPQFPHHLEIDIQNHFTGVFHRYFNSEADSLIKDRRTLDEWWIRSSYYGRGTRNSEEGVCFRNAPDVLYGARDTHDLVAVFPSHTFRVRLNGQVAGIVTIPLETANIDINAFPDPVLNVPVPVTAGPVHILGLSLRDIRSTEDHEVSGIHFRMSV